jgi:hypothetical protein
MRARSSGKKGMESSAASYEDMARCTCPIRLGGTHVLTSSAPSTSAGSQVTV